MNSKLAIFNKYPITLDYTNYKGVRNYRKVIPNFIFYGVSERGYHGNLPSWFLHGICMDRQQSRDFKVDDIHYWNLKHYIYQQVIPIDGGYRLLIKKGLSTEINCSFLNNIYCIKDAAAVNSVYCANIYHIPDLKYHLNETLKKDDTIIFAQNVSLKVPPPDYFL